MRGEIGRRWGERAERYDREYSSRRRAETLVYAKKQHQENRLKALQKVSGQEKPICVGCGCDDLRLLQINHINGGGSRETKKIGSSSTLYCHIITGKRKTDDLNVLCGGCNWLHYVQMKFGDIPIRVVWKGEPLEGL